MRDKKLIELQSSLRLGQNLLQEDQPLTGDLQADLKAINDLVQPSKDIVINRFLNVPSPCALVYQTGLVNTESISSHLLGLVHSGRVAEVPWESLASSPRTALDAILQGKVLILVNGEADARVVAIPASLSPPSPQVERIVRGPHEAFTSQLPQNLALIRRMVPNRALRVESYPLGSGSRTQVVIVFVEGRADPNVRTELLRRLSTYPAGQTIDVTALKPSLADDPWSPFVNVQLTERVDTAASGLLAGRYVVLTSASSQVLLAPTTAFDMMASVEDDYLPRWMGDANRFIRYVSAVTALTLEPIYIAVSSLHQELLPTPLAFAIARSRAGVPLPVFAEVLIMALIIEVLREAAIRLPQVLSQTISIVGALVIGQAVVQASLISAPVIVVVAVTALASFVVPQYELAISIRMLRFPAMIAAGMLGLYGLFVYLLALLIHLARLHSFGTPFLAPLAPIQPKGLQSVIRQPSTKSPQET